MPRSPLFIAGAMTVVVPALAASPARAQIFNTGLGSDTLQGAAPFGNPIRDDRLYGHVLLNQLEGRANGDGTYFRWDGQAWAGTDYDRIWFKSEGRYNANGRGRTSDGDQEILYSRSVSTFFDLQAGLRYDLDSGTGRTWAAIGVQGLAIDFFNVEATAYASNDGHYALRTNASYDLYLTQRLVLQPQLETNWYTRIDRGRGVGPGLSDIDAGLRLRYEFSRKVAPYIGIAEQHRFGQTANLAREQGENANDLRFLFGVRLWY